MVWLDMTQLTSDKGGALKGGSAANNQAVKELWVQGSLRGPERSPPMKECNYESKQEVLRLQYVRGVALAMLCARGRVHEAHAGRKVPRTLESARRAPP